VAINDPAWTGEQWQVRFFEAQRRVLDLEAVVEELRNTVSQQNRQLEEQRRLIQEQSRLLEQQRLQIEQQTLRIEYLQRRLERAGKNSSNSSKPPSSDIVKPPKSNPPGAGKRRPGGQPGHPMHDPPLFAAAQVQARQDYVLERCPVCGGPVELTDNAPHVLQKVELLEQVPWTVSEHRAHACFCGHCQHLHYAPWPAEVERGGMLGPKLLALIAYLKGVMHASFSTIRRHFQDVLHLPISRGRLAKAVDQVSRILQWAHQELGRQLPDQASVRVDETGHKDRGKRHWTWCFRAQLFTWFHIDASRSSQVLLAVLGQDFAGVLSCDYFSAYRKYMGDAEVLVQFCLAHLIRDLKYLAGLSHRPTADYGQGLLEQLRLLFQAIHQNAGADPEELRPILEQISLRIIHLATHAVPASPEAKAMSRRFTKHGQAYFQFITTPGIEPTNNLAEQAIRFVVIDRHITQGTRGDKGQRWCERIWTVLATCAQQGRSALEFLTQTTTAWAHGKPCPSLLPLPGP